VNAYSKWGAQALCVDNFFSGAHQTTQALMDDPQISSCPVSLRAQR
jgi:hypothetical protein